jgi:low affinity Fe/Cu permease
MDDLFQAFAHRASVAVGTKYAFMLALLIVLAWAVLGPVFDFSDTWQLAINTTTTIATFLMVFLIQYTQDRDTRAIHLKLDELVRAVKDARNSLVDVEEQSDKTMERLQEEFREMNPHSSREKA